MKKLNFLIIALALCVYAEAQWINDPVSNTFLANSSADAGEIYLATNTNTGNTYIQWCSFVGGNGWSPTLQRLNFAGEPQWGSDGIHIAAHEFASYSQGVAMTTTTDGSVVSCFAANNDHSYAVKINADGTFAWGEQGVQLFGGQGFSRTEVIAGNDGGIWALGSDYSTLFLQYVNADGTTNPTVTISDSSGKSCAYGQLTLGNDNNVFVTYEKLGSGFGLYKEKQIFVVGYNTDGTQYSPDTMLMSGKTFQVTYIHHVVSDGVGGGYAYIWHSGTNDAFNTYVFHFDQNGTSTIADTNGTPVHTGDPNSFYLDAYATVDPESHDLLIAYQVTDATTQTLCQLFVNRISVTGERLWDEGMMALDNGTTPCSDLRIDAFEDGSGFSLIYHKGVLSGSQSTVEAQAFDMEQNTLWNTQMCSSTYNKTGDEDSTGFHGGQNIVAWVNSNTGGIYGQNINTEGVMGEMQPTSITENEYEEIVTVIAVYNINGQKVNCSDINNLTQGIYILEGFSASGKQTVKKVIR